jgi:hypothetical protein
MKTAVATLAALTLFACASFAHAQPQDPPATPAPAPVVKPLEVLADTLTKIGLEPKVVKKDDETKMLIVTMKLKQGGTLTACIVNEITSPYFIAPLGDGRKLSHQQALDMLEANARHAPCFFVYSKQTGQLGLKIEYPFALTNEKQVQSSLDLLAKTMLETEKIWAAPIVLNDSRWMGEENLQGYGKLAFEFRKGNQVVMHDADGATPGSFTQHDNQVTMTFGGTVYRGVVNGPAMTGAATNGKATWNFRVNLAP